jgi:ribosomal protein S18 acetylase RimI-like enzyme
VIIAHDSTEHLPVGFAIIGRVGVRSYLQRLAVAPEARRRGVARQLVHHASLWADGRGAATMLVNTEPTNTTALALYRSLGFDVLPDSLVVMERAVHVTPVEAS